jgi:hypothetical protein
MEEFPCMLYLQYAYNTLKLFQTGVLDLRTEVLFIATEAGC